MNEAIKWFREIRLGDVAQVGGKTASLGELYGELGAAGVRVPDGFAVTADAYRALLDGNGLRDRLGAILKGVTGEDVAALATAGAELRRLVESAPLPSGLEGAIVSAYRTLAREAGADQPAVAVRSSATAEDLPQASFAGQHESFLGVRGEAALLTACRRCFASIFTDRAIVYRIQNGFDHLSVFLSIAVQKMVASDRGSSGVMFTLDPDSGFSGRGARQCRLRAGGGGRPGAARSGRVLDLQADAAERSSRSAQAQDRPEDVEARHGSRRPARASSGARGGAALRQPQRPGGAGARPLRGRHRGALLAAGRACGADGHRMGEGCRRRPALHPPGAARDGPYAPRAGPSSRSSRCGRAGRGTGSSAARPSASGSGSGRRGGSAIRATWKRFQAGDVLVASMTDPDWEPIMKRAAAIVTDRGGRTCHAAIVSRELGVPCVVGTGNGTELLADGQLVTVSCAEGETGSVYAGALPFERRQVDLAAMPRTRDPGDAQRRQSRRGLPAGRPAQRRRRTGAHRVHHRELRARASARAAPPGARRAIRPRGRRSTALTAGYADRGEYFVERLAEGVGDDRGRLLPEGRDRPPLGLQVQRVRGARGRSGLRARGRQSHARLPRRVPLRAPALPGRVRARVPGPAPGPRADGPHQREADDPVLPDSGARAGACSICWPPTGSCAG